MNGIPVQRLPVFERANAGRSSDWCGTPVDLQFFDESRLTAVPEIGREEVLARFELPMHYCGVFENFSQFIGDVNFEPLARVATPGLEWRLLINNRPLAPYLRLEHVANPWGFNCCPVAIRLDEGATLEFVVRNVSHDKSQDGAIQTVGGRIAGRFWYNPAYGDVSARGSRFG